MLQAVVAGVEPAVESSLGGDGRPEGADFLWSPQDHQVVPDTPIHNLRCQDAREALERWLVEQGREGFVAHDHNVYWDIHDLRRVVAPDVFIVHGVSLDLRQHNYRIWVTGVAPCFVMEFLSPSTRTRDLGEKKRIYEAMGVQEYFVFEGEEEVDDQGRRRGPRISPALQGFRLRKSDMGQPRYRRIPSRGSGLRAGVKVTVSYASEVLGLDVVCAVSKNATSESADRVRFHDPANNRFIPNVAEWREAETRRADEETRRADGATRRADEETRRADEETRRADEETRRADGEARRADAAEARIAELERQLAQRS